MIDILTEVGPSVGLGHLTRMRSLARQLSADGYRVRLHVQLEERSGATCPKMENGETACHWINDLDAVRRLVDPAGLAIMDTYGTTATFIEAASRLCRRLIVIDDTNRIPYTNCVVVNPNFYGAEIDYPALEGTDYYLGGGYTLLRPEFVPERKREVSVQVHRILVTIGGTDVLGLTRPIVRFLHGIAPQASLDVVTTSSYADQCGVETELTARDTLHRDIDAYSMNALMNAADFAVASAGSTTNELFRTHCPSALVQVADNQTETISRLGPLGYFVVFTPDDFKPIRDMLDAGVRHNIQHALATLRSESTAKDLVERLYDRYAREATE